MDSALTLLLNLQKLSLSSQADRSVLATVPPEDLAAEMLAEILSEQEIQQVQDMYNQWLQSQGQGMGNPGRDGFPMGKTDHAPSAMSNPMYPYSPQWAGR